jgi:hypothetical protein
MNYTQTKEWLSQHLNKTYLINTDEYDILYTLIQKHPSYQDWKFQNPYAFKIIKKKYLQLLVSFVNIDKNTKYRIVSWVSCCKKVSKVDPLTSAMRQSIKRQISIYKNKHPNRECELCHVKEKIEVDHIVKFVNLKNQFIENNIIPINFEYHPKRGYYLFKKVDQDFKRNWQKYHLKHASYRYLCSTCNKKV